MLYSSLRNYFVDNKISLALIAEFFEHYGVTVNKLNANQTPEIATLIGGVPGQVIPVEKKVDGLRCWTREDAVASALEKLRGVFCGTGATSVMVYDNQEIVESWVGERTAYKAILTVYFFRIASEDMHVREHRVS